MICKKLWNTIREADYLATGTRAFLLRNLREAEEANPELCRDGQHITGCFSGLEHTPQGWLFWKTVGHMLQRADWWVEDYPEEFLDTHDKW